MPPPPQQQNSGRLTFGQKMQIAAYLARFPALTVMIALRDDLGYRLLNPLHLIVAAAFMVGFALFFQQGKGWELLIAYAGIFIYIAFQQRTKRWQEISRGVRQHSYYIGTSFLRWKHLPAFFHRYRRVERFIDPIFGAAWGLALWPFVPVLGLWLIIASLCLRIMEAEVFKREFNRALDTADGLLTSQYQSETVEHFSVPSSPVQDANEESPGIPTGLGNDIQRKVKK